MNPVGSYLYTSRLQGMQFCQFSLLIQDDLPLVSRTKYLTGGVPGYVMFSFAFSFGVENLPSRARFGLRLR